MLEAFLDWSILSAGGYLLITRFLSCRMWLCIAHQKCLLRHFYHTTTRFVTNVTHTFMTARFVTNEMVTNRVAIVPF